MLNHEPKSQNLVGLWYGARRYFVFQCSTTSRRAKTSFLFANDKRTRSLFQCSTTSRRAKTVGPFPTREAASAVSVLNHEPKSQNLEEEFYPDAAVSVSVLNHEPKSQNPRRSSAARGAAAVSVLNHEPKSQNLCVSEVARARS